MQNYTTNEVIIKGEANERELSAHMSGVFGWMFAGLLLTAAMALFTVTNSSLFGVVYGNMWSFAGFAIAEIIIVMVLSANIQRFSYTTSVMLFLAYSALNGITLSIIFLTYRLGTVWTAFLITAGAFGIMAVYGYVTKKDLSSMRRIVVMGMVGLFLMLIMQMFIRMSGMDLLICALGLFVFLGLTAYDAQKIKEMYYRTADDDRLRNNLKIHGALVMYLDFINVFLYVLRLLGRNRD